MDNLQPLSSPRIPDPPLELATEKLERIVLSFADDLATLTIMGLVMLVMISFFIVISFLSVTQRFGFGLTPNQLVVVLGVASVLSVTSVVLFFVHWVRSLYNEHV